MLYCFLDTNMFLQYQMFDEIDWLSVLQTKQVCLVVPKKVIQELDKHKHDPQSSRRRNRARSVLKKLALYWESEEKRVRNGTTLLLQTFIPSSDWLKSNHYELEDSDDLIVGAVHHFKIEHSEYEVVLFADDYGARLKAVAANIKAIEPPESLLLPDEPDPIQKENQELKRELFRLQNAQPKLVMYFEDESGNLKNEITYIVDFSDVLYSDTELSDKLAKKQVSLKYSGYIDGEVASIDNSAQESIFDLSHLGTIYPTQEQVEEYHSSLEEYIQTDYKDFLLESAKYKTIEKRTRTIKIRLENSGTSPAQNIDVQLHFPEGFVIDEFPPQEPKEPKPPSKLEPNRPLDFFTSRMFSDIPMIARLPSIHTVAQPRPALTIRKTNSYEVEWSTDSLKHNFIWHWSELYLTFEAIDKSFKVFEVPYQITADNIPDRIEGKMLIKVHTA